MRGDRLKDVEKSSENGRGAGLECRPRRAQMGELGVGDEEKRFDGVGQEQGRRRCEHHLVCHRQDGADHARLARWLIGVVAALLVLARSIGSEALRVRQIHQRLDRGRALRSIEVEMPERQHELRCQREQRQPRTRSYVSPEPLHGITDVTL
jgi:hypothetical protein